MFPEVEMLVSACWLNRGLANVEEEERRVAAAIMSTGEKNMLGKGLLWLMVRKL